MFGVRCKPLAEAYSELVLLVLIYFTVSGSTRKLRLMHGCIMGWQVPHPECMGGKLAASQWSGTAISRASPC